MTLSTEGGEPGKCGGCNRPIFWVPDEHGKRVPVTKEGELHDVSHIGTSVVKRR